MDDKKLIEKAMQLSLTAASDKYDIKPKVEQKPLNTSK
jgi:hypothetical protein